MDAQKVSKATDPECFRDWFCLRTHPKHEHVAASQLRQMEDVEVYNPRIRFPRATSRGVIWITEALFPSYLFARFDWKTSLTKVHYSPGVSGVVHFGTRWPTVPDEVMQELQASLGEDQVHVVTAMYTPGDEVEVAGGPFRGLSAVVTRVMPGKDRVMILLDFLGRQTSVEVGVHEIIKEGLGR